ncbi:MAG: hypothetical protein Q4Q62_03065 [Thermoplasmata archaeon]|nr:hypothetical protein [Thermoplasmata archaeon]
MRLVCERRNDQARGLAEQQGWSLKAGLDYAAGTNLGAILYYSHHLDSVDQGFLDWVRANSSGLSNTGMVVAIPSFYLELHGADAIVEGIRRLSAAMSEAGFDLPAGPLLIDRRIFRDTQTDIAERLGLEVADRLDDHRCMAVTVFPMESGGETEAPTSAVLLIALGILAIIAAVAVFMLSVTYHVYTGRLEAFMVIGGIFAIYYGAGSIRASSWYDRMEWETDVPMSAARPGIPWRDSYPDIAAAVLLGILAIIAASSSDPDVRILGWLGLVMAASFLADAFARVMGDRSVDLGFRSRSSAMAFGLIPGMGHLYLGRRAGAAPLFAAFVSSVCLAVYALLESLDGDFGFCAFVFGLFCVLVLVFWSAILTDRICNSEDMPYSFSQMDITYGRMDIVEDAMFVVMGLFMALLCGWFALNTAHPDDVVPLAVLTVAGAVMLAFPLVRSAAAAFSHRRMLRSVRTRPLLVCYGWMIDSSVAKDLADMYGWDRVRAGKVSPDTADGPVVVLCQRPTYRLDPGFAEWWSSNADRLRGASLVWSVPDGYVSDRQAHNVAEELAALSEDLSSSGIAEGGWGLLYNPRIGKEEQEAMSSALGMRTVMGTPPGGTCVLALVGSKLSSENWKFGRSAAIAAVMWAIIAAITVYSAVRVLDGCERIELLFPALVTGLLLVPAFYYAYAAAYTLWLRGRKRSGIVRG